MPDKSAKIAVCGAGGFIGGHLVANLLRQGYTNIRTVDQKPFDDWYQIFPEVENLQLDLQGKEACKQLLAKRSSSTTSPPTWAAWASSKTTARSAC